MGFFKSTPSLDAVELKLTEAVETMEKTCTQKPPADPFSQPSWGMSGAHAVFFIGLKNMYSIAPSIHARDTQDFVHYCLFWVANVEHHHHFEEDWYFEQIDKAVSVAQIKGEHAKFTEQFEAIQHYLISCLPKGSTWGPWEVVIEEEKLQDFNAEKLRNLISTIVLEGDFIQHLCDEITYLDPARLRGSGLTYEEMSTVNQKTNEHFKHTPPAYLCWNLRHTAKGDFPVVPWMVKNVYMKYVHYWPGRRVYRFGPGPA